LECKAYVGRGRIVTDGLAVERARQMQLCLDRQSVLEDGDPLPLLWHWIYFTEPVRQSDLGADGHEKLGYFLPAIRYPRRMWAGGEVNFKAPLLLGQMAEKSSTIESINFKRGASGPLCFVNVRHRITQGGAQKLNEVQTIVFRDKATAPQSEQAKSEGTSAGAVAIGRTQLFRYSALTFNAHRIHYDEKFAVEEEGYPGLIVHGPLLASLLADYGATLEPDKTLRQFTYRAVQPAFENEPFLVEGSRTDGGADLQIVKRKGGTAMRAKIHWV
jgi:3-methylfumaryl-CoA hydratase